MPPVLSFCTTSPPPCFSLQGEWKEVKVLVTQLCPTLCNPMDCSSPGSSVHGILQARILEWVAISFSRGSSRPRDWTQVSCIAGRFVTLWAPLPHFHTSPSKEWYTFSFFPAILWNLKSREQEINSFSDTRNWFFVTDYWVACGARYIYSRTKTLDAFR